MDIDYTSKREKNNIPPNKSRLITLLPILSLLVVIIFGGFNHSSKIEIAKLSILALVLSAVILFYIRMHSENINNKKYAKFIIVATYLLSICLIMLPLKTEAINLWMIGGLAIAMLVDNNLGLLVHINLTFLASISFGHRPETVVYLLIIGLLMCMLSDFMKQKSSVVYVMIIVLSTNITLTFVLNNFIFEPFTNMDYLYPVFGTFVVLIVCYLLYMVYHKLVMNNIDAYENISDKNVQNLANETLRTESIELPKDTLMQPQYRKFDENVLDTKMESMKEIEVPLIDELAVDNELTLENELEIYSKSTLEDELTKDNEATEDNKLTIEDELAVNNILTLDDELAVVNELSLESELFVENEVPINNELFITNMMLNENRNSETEDIQEENIEIPSSYEVLIQEDFELLMKIKEYSNNLYEHSKKIGELSYQAALTVGANEILAKAGGLYHDVGKMNGKNYIEEGLKIAEEYKFSEELKKVLRQHNIKYEKPSIIESVIVMLSDNVLSTMEYIEKTGGNKKLTPNSIIDNLFQMRLDKGTFDESGLSVRNYMLLKEYYQSVFMMDYKIK